MHPKSLSTASLFTTTAVLSFLVVVAPHILPCPATGPKHAESTTTSTALLQEKHRKKKRRCPIPRPTPGGLVGEVLRKEEIRKATEVESFWGKKVVFEERIGKG